MLNFHRRYEYEHKQRTDRHTEDFDSWLGDIRHITGRDDIDGTLSNGDRGSDINDRVYDEASRGDAARSEKRVSSYYHTEEEIAK